MTIRGHNSVRESYFYTSQKILSYIAGHNTLFCF